MLKAKKKGITLISLVITIVVLLILAAVAITLAVDSDGLFRRAEEAEDKWNSSVQEEQQLIAGLEDILNELETGVKVEKVTDTKPGELELEEEVYVINSIEDLVFFSHDVRNGNTYEGQTVKLGLSLDFNSTKSYVDAFRTDYGEYGYDRELKLALTTGEGFKPIGDYYNSQANNFKGSFNGNNKIIYNLYININVDDGYFRAGLFGRNDGSISNLGLANVNITAKNLVFDGHTGSICGQTANSGSIESCFATGKINSMLVSVGGMTGYSNGKINNCYSAVNITNSIISETKTTTTVFVGGISSNMGERATVTNSYNAGEINHTSGGYNIIIGGVAGRLDGQIKNCYNIGNIKINLSNADYFTVGGLVGEVSTGVAILENCHTIAKLDITCTEAEPKIGGAIGRNTVRGEVIEVYYLSANAETGIGWGTDNTTPVEEQEDMEPILSVLNTVESGEGAFKASDNGGNPILSWQN